MSDMSLPDAIAALKVHARQMEAVQTVAAAVDDAAAFEARLADARVKYEKNAEPFLKTERVEYGELAI